VSTIDPTLTIVRSQSTNLIHAEINAHNERVTLERAVKDAICKLGYRIDDVSEASGLAPDEINRLLANVPSLEDELAALAGVC